AWDKNDIDQKEIYTYKSKKTVFLSGVKTEVCVVRVEESGARMDAEVLPEGRHLSARLGKLLTLKLEKEAAAKQLDKGMDVDLFSLASVPVDRNLGRARLVDELTLEVTGLGNFKLPQSHRQKLTPGKEKATLELKRDFRIDKAVPLTKKEQERYTKATPRL